MTVIVGVLCKQGVVIGSDSSSTSVTGNISTTEQNSKKVEIINKEVIMCGTGSVGINQRFIQILSKTFNDNAFKSRSKSNIDIATHITREAILDCKNTFLNDIGYGSCVGFRRNNEYFLCEFETRTLQPEFKHESFWYVSMGSGQLIADPFLGFVRKVFWDNKQPDIEDGIFGTILALEHAIDVNPGGIGPPIQIAVLKNGEDARLLDEVELEEHKQNVINFENYVKEYKTIKSNIGESIPEMDK